MKRVLGKRVFGKRHKPDPTTRHIDIPADRNVSDTAMPAIVRQSDTEFNSSGRNHLVEAVADLAEQLVEYGRYRWREVPAPFIQIHCASDYIGQVKNGRHSQYVANRIRHKPTRSHVMSPGPGPIELLDPKDRLDYLICGAANGRADPHCEILNELARWVEDNLEAVDQQTGFQGGRAAALEMLDNRFFNLEKTNPLESRLANWIASWPNLKILPDDLCNDALHRLYLQNPLRDARLAAQQVASLQQRIAAEGIAGEHVERTAAALDLLVRRAGLNPGLFGLALEEGVTPDAPEETHWRLITCENFGVNVDDFERYYAMVGDLGGVLLTKDESIKPWTATDRDIADHLNFLRSGAISN